MTGRTGPGFASSKGDDVQRSRYNGTAVQRLRKSRQGCALIWANRGQASSWGQGSLRTVCIKEGGAKCEDTEIMDYVAPLCEWR